MKCKFAKLDGGERISSLFKYTLTLVSEDADLGFAKLIAKARVVKFTSEHHDVRSPR